MRDIQIKSEIYYPEKEIINKAYIKNWDELNERVKNDFLGFWASMANELFWFKKWEKVLED